MIDYDSNTKVYLCHFPGDTNILQNLVKKYVKQRYFVSDKISVVCAFNKEVLTKEKLLPLNIKNSKVFFEPDILNEKWDMNLKIPNILKSLKRCNTEYVLITDVRDVIFTANLDTSFINKFKELNCDIVYNATTSKYPKINLPSDYLIEGGSYPFSYLNAGVCFGKTDKLIEWYEHCNKLFENNRSEQFIMRKMYEPNFNIKIDGYRKLFRSCHSYDTIFFKERKKLYLAKSKDAYINVDNKLKYKTILPNKKIIKGKIKINKLGEERLFYETDFISLNNTNLEKLRKYKTKKCSLILNYKDNVFNEKNYFKLIPFLKEIDRIEFNIYNKKNLDFIFNKIKNFEFNCINKIIFNIFINEKKINFPFDDRIEVKYYPTETNKKTFKITDTKRSGYYKIKLSKEEAKIMVEKNKLLPVCNYIKVHNNILQFSSKDYWVKGENNEHYSRNNRRLRSSI